MSQPPNTQQQQQPPPGYYQAAPPPKKKHTVRNVVLVLLGVGILLFAGCIMLVGGAVSEVDKAIQEEAANDAPVEVMEGKPFEHDGYEVAGGWTVVEEKFGGGASIKKMSVTNTLDESRSALLTFRFYKGNENLAEVECTSNQMQAGEVSTLSCFSFDSKFPQSYQDIKVSDAW